MNFPKIKTTAKVWLYPGNAAWHFVTISEEIGEELKSQYPWPRRGFGAIPVSVNIDDESWETSIFPEKTGTYLLPIKKVIREKVGIKVGDKVNLTLQINSKL